MTITLHNLTAQQKLLAEILWNMQSSESVAALIKLLPEPYKHDAKVVRELMTAAVFDQHTDTVIAQEALSKFRK